MARLVVRLLGGYRVELDGQPIYGFETDKARALLAYLIVEADRPHRRETLASLLWPERPDDIARANLRQALTRVRRALADYAAADRRSNDSELPPFLFITSADVQFNTASDYTLDVAELEALANLFGRASATHPPLLPTAYCADFLVGFAVPDSEAFQAWVLSKQEYYHRLTLDILDEQGAIFEGLGDYEQAAAAAHLQLQLEPWLEEAHRRCMRSLALAGRCDEALHQYEACCRTLQAELGVTPAADTQALYAEIRAGRLAAPPAAAPLRPQAATSVSAALRQSALPVRVVARADELGQLSRHLDAALAGQTRVAFVGGVAGSGKTALLEAFAADAMAEHPDLLVAAARCSSGGSLDPLAPLRKLTEMLFGDLENDVAWWLHDATQSERLHLATAHLLAALGEHAVDLIGPLIPASSVVRRGRAAAAAKSDLERNRIRLRSNGARAWWTALANRAQAEPLSQSALFDQLLSTLAAISREQPLLLLLDDLHWVDEVSAAFLLHLGRELDHSRLMVLVAYRSATVALGRRDPRTGETSRHPLAAVINELRRIHGDIAIDLDRTDGRAFVEAYVDTEPNRLGARFRDALYLQTGGHALFTVESLRNLQERGELYKDEAGRWVAHEALNWGALPARVEATIGERIDRLPEPCHRFLACASVQGDSFSGEVVAELTGASPNDVLRCFSDTLARQHHLVRPEGLQRLDSGERSVYRFTHHLFQKYLYDQLDPVERVRWHGGVAAALARQVAADAAARERVSPQLAWHYESAGLPLHAAHALCDAGRQAMQLSAFREALNRYDHGLALLADVPPSEERTEVAGLLEVARLGAFRNVEWVGSAGMGGTLARAAEALAADAEGRPKLMLLTAETEQMYATGQFTKGLLLAERLRAEAEQAGEEYLVVMAQFSRAMIHHLMGHVRESQDDFDAVLARLTPEGCKWLRSAIGMDLHVNTLALSAINQWLLGYPEAALARSRKAVAVARAEGYALGQAASLALNGNLLYCLRSDDNALRSQCELCRRLTLEHSIITWQVYSDVLLGGLMVAAGQLAGLGQMDIESWRASGIVVGVDFFTIVLADSCLRAVTGRLPDDDAAAPVARDTLLAHGLAAVDCMLGPERIPCGQLYETEMRRLWGELLLERDGLAAAKDALAHFHRAQQLGQEQGARAWQLRAAMSIVRLRARQGQAYAIELADARRDLAGIYAQFTEGFAFADLQEAAALMGDRGDQGVMC